MAATASTSSSSGCGKIDAGAISAEESRFTHRHLFAFELAGDADDGDYDVGILRSGDGFRRRRVIRLWPRSVRACGLLFLVP